MSRKNAYHIRQWMNDDEEYGDGAIKAKVREISVTDRWLSAEFGFLDCANWATLDFSSSNMKDLNHQLRKVEKLESAVNEFAAAYRKQAEKLKKIIEKQAAL